MESVISKSAETDEQNFENVKQFEQNALTRIQTLKQYAVNVTIEPVIILYVLPMSIASLAMQNLTLEKACRVNLKFKEETCSALTSRNFSVYTKEDEIVVQKLVASMFAWKIFLHNLIPAMLLLFLGSWSDRHRRRKPLILLSILGDASTCVGYLLCTYFFYELRMELIGISEALPPALTGGWYSFLMASFSYIASMSSIKNRTGKIGVVYICLETSNALGLALSGVLFKTIQFYGVFWLCLVLLFFAAIYGFFRIKEDGNKRVYDSANIKSTSADKPSKIGFLKDFFDLKHIKETIFVVFKNGQNNRKMRVCSIFVLIFVLSGPYHGEMGVMYLYVRYRFGWNEIDYSLYATYKVILHMFGTTFSLAFFSKFLQLDDSLLGVISTTSKLCASFVYAFAPTAIIFYLGPLVEILNGTSNIAMRSIITKLVLPEELGKVNSLFGVCEALVPLVYGPMYSMLYKATINVFPGSFLLVGGLLTFPATLVFLWLYFQHTQDEKEAKQNETLKKELLK